MSRKTLIFSGSTIIITILLAILYIPQSLKQRQPTKNINTMSMQSLPTIAPTIAPTPNNKSALEIAYDKQRRTDLLNIINALYLFSIERAKLPEDFPINPTCIGKDAECYDLEYLVPNHINRIPQDPQSGSTQNTGYFVFLDDGRLTASASSGIVVRK